LTFQVIFDGNDVAELAGLDEFIGLLVSGRAATLRAYGEDTIAFFDGVANGFGVFHGVREWFFDVGVAAGVDGFDAVEGVLKKSAVAIITASTFLFS